MKLLYALVVVALCGFSAAGVRAAEAEGEVVEALDVAAIEADAATLADADADADVDSELLAESEANAAAADTDSETDTAAADETEETEGAAEAESEEVVAEEEEAEVEAETEAEGETERFRESAGVDAEAAARVEMDGVLELTDASGEKLYAEESADDAAEDAEDEQAYAEEAAIASSARFQERSRSVAYDEGFAKEASAYAQAANFPTDPQRCARKLGHSDFEIVHTVKSSIFDGSTIFAYTAKDDSKSRLIIGFHGDITPAKLAKRLWTGKPIKYKVLCKSCKTHKYFALVNSKVCPELIASARMLARENPDYEVVITGHGMGGALASLCGYEMEMARVFRTTNRRRFITYGQPRVGNCHLARKFNQFFPHAIRVTHGDDPVSHIAPCHVDPNSDAPQRCIEIKDRKKRLWAFHNPTQVWYPAAMPRFDDASAPKGDFSVCQGDNWGEDETCRSHPLGFSMADHRHYFGVNMINNCAKVLGTL